MSLIRNRRVCFFDDPTTNPAQQTGQTEGGDSKSTFTKEQVDAILANDRNVHKERLRQMETKLQEMQAAQNVPAELQTQLEEARNLLKTKEQVAKEQAEKLQKQALEKEKSLTEEANKWRSLFQNTQIRREITEAAAKHDAFSPSQIYALLKDTTRLDTTETGDFVTTVEITELIDGRPTPVRMVAAEAVKRMVDRPDEYGNLFKSTANAGLGRSNGPGGRKIDPNNIGSLEEYALLRKQISGRGK